MNTLATTYMEVYDHIQKTLHSNPKQRPGHYDASTISDCVKHMTILKDAIRMIDKQVDGERESNLSSKELIPDVLIDQNKYQSGREKYGQQCTIIVIVNTYEISISYDAYYQTLGDIRHRLMNLHSEWAEAHIRKQRRVCQVSKKALCGGGIYIDGRNDPFPRNPMHFCIKGRTL